MCKWCEQPEDGGLDFATDKVRLGAFGALEVTSGLWNYKYQDKAFLLFDVWHHFNDMTGEDVADQKVYISYCPFCGKKLEEARKDDT